MKIRAILFGATGMVGEGVLLESLKHPNVESVLVIGRRPCNVKHPKLSEILHQNFFDYSDIENKLRGYDACFFCLGVSSVGMKETEYTRITYDLTMQAATTLSKLNQGMTFCYVSGTGTDSTEQGRLMWARVKGRTENDLAKLPFKSVYAFRPGLMKPIKGQKNVKTIFKVVGYSYPIWKFLSPKNVCTLEEVGLAMIQAVRVGYSKKVLENLDIVQLARTNSGGST
ncbi:MAG: epimerase [Ignavibacteriales bacterium]|nr:epimerase [Ignavibacteriales bacterium]